MNRATAHLSDASVADPPPAAAFATSINSTRRNASTRAARFSRWARWFVVCITVRFVCADRRIAIKQTRRHTVFAPSFARKQKTPPAIAGPAHGTYPTARGNSSPRDSVQTPCNSVSACLLLPPHQNRQRATDIATGGVSKRLDGRIPLMAPFAHRGVVCFDPGHRGGPGCTNPRMVMYRMYRHRLSNDSALPGARPQAGYRVQGRQSGTAARIAGQWTASGYAAFHAGADPQRRGNRPDNRYPRYRAADSDAHQRK